MSAAARREAEDYYRLCREAEALGLPVSLDDPRSPRTVAGLQALVNAATAPEHPFFVLLGSGEWAEADDEGGALLAARTLRRERRDHGLGPCLRETHADVYYDGSHVLRIPATQTI